MRQLKFKIVIPSYNNEVWCEYNIASILNQEYTNYEVLYIDDCSTDNTYSKVLSLVGHLPNWKVVCNESNKRRGYNLNPHNPLIHKFVTDDEDVLVFIDGDDWLYDDQVLKNLNRLYDERNYWMTYGKFVCYPSGEVGNPQNTPYPTVVHELNQYRQDTWRASHLRTFKWHLYKAIKEEDLIFTQTGEFYYHAEDLATSFPCLEMCPENRIGVVDFYTYVYNTSQENRDRVVNDSSREPGGYQYELAIRETEVRSRSAYKTRERIAVSNLGGGLGNMMFMTAAAYALARKSGHTLYFNPNHYGYNHGDPITFKDTIFRKIPLLKTKVPATIVSETSFSYDPIHLPDENVAITGYFQSPKYFKECENEIRVLFEPTQEIVERLQKSPYGHLLSTAVSMHIRRGNYIQLATHHYNLPVEYYKNAMSYFKGYKFLVFSDDIEWCKQNFTENDCIFVENSNTVDDLYLMSLCKHHIIANSTFSWWGAWLDSKSDKKVVYPDKWFGPGYASWNTADIFPDEWICLKDESPEIIVNLFDGAFGHLVKPNGRYSSVHGKISSKVTFIKDQMEFKGITLFTDGYLNSPIVDKVKSKYKIGWLLETREVDPSRYDQFESYMDRFDFVMTHDAALLSKYPNKTRFTIFGGTWIKNKNYRIPTKTKNLSMIYSDKQYLPGHKLRHLVAAEVGGIDLYGRGTKQPVQYKEECLLDYRYSIIIENAKTINYFTEKLIDALLTGTIPIYWGCPNISDFFDTEGMIIVDSLEDIKNVVANLNENEYINRIDNILRNMELAKKYDVTEDWIYDHIFKELV